MNPIELFNRGRFHEAVEAYERQLSAAADDIGATDGLAVSLMAVGRYSDAIPLLQKVGNYERDKNNEALGREIELSVCNWLCGNREEGLAIMQQLVLDTLSGKVAYMPDLAGGATQGLLLRYMAVTSQDNDARHLTERFLTKICKSKKAHLWPGPAAQFAMGLKSFDEMLFEGVGTRDLDQAKLIASKDLLKRRWLTNALFNAAVNERINGNELGCKQWMKECAQLANPLIEYDWHLAKKEAEGQ